MKKILYTMMAFAIATFALTSCEDVPCPYDIPSAGGDEPDPTPTEELLGTGTESDPYNVAAALDAASALESGATTSEKVYIKGVVTSVKECSAQYGNATFYLGDSSDATTTFYVYRCLGLGGKNITSDDAVQVGDTIIVYGNVTNYNGTIETVQKDAYIYYSSRLGNGSSSSSDNASAEAKGTGTLADPFNVAAAVAYVNKLGANVTSENEVYIKGKVLANNTTASTISSYGNMTFTIIDEGFEGTTFTAYQVYGPNKEKFTSVDQIKAGQTVVLCGKVVNYYGNTPETTGKGASYVVSIEGEGTSSSTETETSEIPEPTAASAGVNINDNVVTLASGATATSAGAVVIDLSTAASENGTAVESVTLSDGSTIVFDKGSNTNAPKYYTATKGVRVYGGNTMTFTCPKTIAQIVITCDVNGSTKYVGQETATVTFDGKTAVYTNAGSATTQLRAQKIIIYYASSASAKRAKLRRK